MLINASGLLYPDGPTFVSYQSNETLKLQVNITQRSFADRFLWELTWYHNGLIINGSNDPRVSLSSDNTTLTISSTKETDAGVCEVKYAGLRVYPYDRTCEYETLSLVGHYPLLSPAIFYVQAVGKELINILVAIMLSDKLCDLFTGIEPIKVSDEYKPRAHFTTPDATVTFVSSAITLRVDGRNPSSYADVIYITWYFNGEINGLPLGVSVALMEKTPSSFLQVLTIENPGIQHSGIYQAVLWMNPYTYLSQFDCPRGYADFITYSSRARIGSPMILDVVTFELKFNGKCYNF